jgi:hypothetical protein
MNFYISSHTESIDLVPKTFKSVIYPVRLSYYYKDKNIQESERSPNCMTRSANWLHLPPWIYWIYAAPLKELSNEIGPGHA